MPLTEIDVTLAVVGILEEVGAQYMVTGSLASSVWAGPRITQDVDIVIQTESFDLGQFFDRLGAEYRNDRQLQFEGVTGTHRYVLTHLPSRFKVELFILTDDPFDQERFARRVRLSLGGRQAVFSAAEDAVVQKLLWLLRSREDKHRKDVRDMLAAQRSSLDWDYVRSWADRHGTRALLEEIAAELDG